MTERWLPISGYEGSYEVSDLGRVRSLDRTVTASNGAKRRYRGRLLTPSRSFHSAKGGKRVVLPPNSVWYVARLVLETFVGPCPAGMESYHKEDPDDDSLENLGWRAPAGQRGGSRVGLRGRRNHLSLTLAGWWAAEGVQMTTPSQVREPDSRWRITPAGLAALATLKHEPPPAA